MIQRKSAIVVFVGAGLALLSAVVLLAAPLGYRWEVLPLLIALLTVLRWGAYGAAAAAAVSFVGLILELLQSNKSRLNISVAVASILFGLVIFSIPAGFRLGPQIPPIHDITTDTNNPPEFVAVVSMNTPGRTVYEGPSIAIQQQEAYPDIQPIVLDEPADEVFNKAVATVEEMGWDLVDADPSAGRVEATDTTFWFGFKDDVVIRIQSEGMGSRMDVRSLSRVGGSDVGKNAERIREFVSVFKSN